MKNNLKQLREAKGWSQAVLGEKLGIAHNSVSGYENGKTFLAQEMIERFAKALEVSADEIEVYEDGDLSEGSSESRAGVALELFSTAFLKQMEQQLSAKHLKSHGEEKNKALASLVALTAELNRRDPEDPNIIRAEEKNGPMGDDGRPVSPEVEQAARRMLKEVIQQILAAGDKPKKGK